MLASASRWTPDVRIRVADVRLRPAYAPLPLGPPAAPESRCRNQAHDRLLGDDERDQGGPHRDPADEVVRPVDGVHDPTPRPVTRRLELLAHHGVARSSPGELGSDEFLCGPIGVAHEGQVRLWSRRRDPAT